MGFDVTAAQLRALRAVLDTGSFTAAADGLGFTQSALSKQISSLEAVTGTDLFTRGPRGVAPTEAALRLAHRATAILDHLDAAERELTDLGQPVGGRVTLGAFPTAAMELTPMVIARVRAEHPAVQVSFSEASTPVLLRKLRAGRLDLAIIADGDGLPEWDLTGIDTDRLASGKLLIAVHRQHRLAQRAIVAVAELVDEAWVAGHGTRNEPQFGPWPSLPDPHIVATLGDWSTRLGFVSAGLGITTIPSLVAGALPAGIVTVAVDDADWPGRSLLLARIRPPSPSAATVRRAVLHSAGIIADRYR